MKKNIIPLLSILIIGVVLLSYYNSRTPDSNVYLISIISIVLVGISGYMVSLIMKDRKKG